MVFYSSIVLHWITNTFVMLSNNVSILQPAIKTDKYVIKYKKKKIEKLNIIL